MKNIDNWIERNEKKLVFFSGAMVVVLLAGIVYGIYFGAKETARRAEMKKNYYSVPYDK